MPNEPGEAFEQREHQVDADSEQGRAQAALYHLFGCRGGRHGFIVSCSSGRRAVTVPKVFFFWNPSCPIWRILTKLSLEKAISRSLYPTRPLLSGGVQAERLVRGNYRVHHGESASGPGGVRCCAF